MKWIVRNPKYSVPGGLALLAGLAYIAFGFFGVHLLFVDNEVSEPPPVFAASATQPLPPATTDTATADTATSPATVRPTVRPTVSTAPTTPQSSPATTTQTSPPATAEPVVPVTSAPAIATEYSGTFVGRNHPTSGNAIVLGDGSGQRFLRFEAFETDNGPDLNVYLVNSSVGGVDDFIDLGNLKGNIGDQNYEIPREVDLDVHDTVLIWCVRFASAFGEATLVPT
jgi:hypothetical protein